MEALLKKLDQWHEDDEHQLIIDEIDELNADERDYQIQSMYARALNNLNREAEALAVLLELEAQGQDDSLWHFRVGYALYYMGGREADSIPYFERSIELGDKGAYAKMLLDMAKKHLSKEQPVPANDEECLNTPDDAASVKYLTEEFREEIKPFFFSVYKGNYSALLDAGSYRNDIFEEYYEEKGCEGGGYDWDALADFFIKMKLPEYQEVLHHDSEAGMFCLTSKNEQAIYEFLKEFKIHCDNDARFRNLMDHCDFEAWD